jgi:hypothetical protein
MEKEIEELREELNECRSRGYVPKNRAIVQRKNSYEIIIFDEDTN